MSQLDYQYDPGELSAEELPGRLSTGAMDRPSLAAANLIRADVSGAVRSVFAPTTLSPRQMRTLADELGLGGPGDPVGTALRAFTNPLVIAGGILSLRYPVPAASEMFRYHKSLSGMERKVSWLGRHLYSMDDLYAGLDLPENAKKLLREDHLFKVKYQTKATQIIEDAARQGFHWTPRNQALVAAKLKGLDQTIGNRKAILREINEGPVFDSVVKGMRGVLDEVRDEVYADPSAQKVLRSRAMQKYWSPQDRTLLSKSAEKWVWRENYFPEMSAPTREDFETRTQKMMEASGYRKENYATKTQRAAAVESPASALPRTGRMFTSPADLDLIGDYLIDEKLPAKYRVMIAQNPAIRTYSLQTGEVVAQHIHTNARARAWALVKGTYQGAEKPLGEAIIAETMDLGRTDPHRAALMADSYIPMMLGRKTHDQIVAAAAWNQTRANAMKTLESPILAKVLPAGMKEWLGKSIINSKGSFSPGKLSSNIAGWLYASTLGGNLMSASFNLLQYLLTTVPTIGMSPAVKGLKAVLKAAPEYFTARRAGLIHDAAIAKAFPKYVESGLATQSLVDTTLAGELDKSWDLIAGPGGRLARGADRVKSGMMAVFQATENLVRLGSFEGGYAKAAAEGLSHEKALDFARRITETTQFLSGPAMTPAMLLEWSPAMKQLAQFPMRTVGFFAGPATQMGSAAKSGLFNRNWGTLGRAMLTSGLAYETAKGLFGKDISRGLMFGALPIPSEDQPFSPMPIVPPVLGIAGNVALDVVSGTTERTQRSLPLLVPGGLGLSRFAGMVSPGLAKAIRRPYADYENRAPDGRVPVYTADGQLKGYYTDGQLWAEALGVGGQSSTNKAEQETMQYLLAQRDRIRAYRREFLEAQADNDSDRAVSINEEFKQAYPMFRNGIVWEEKDMQAIALRRNVTRLERTLDTMPAEVRGQFGAVVVQALAGQAEALMGVDPSLLVEQGSARARDPYRVQPAQNVIEGMVRRRADAGELPTPARTGAQSRYQHIRNEYRRRSAYGLGRTANPALGSRTSFSDFSGSPF